MYCRKCGSELKENAKFCSICGVSVNINDKVEVKPQIERKVIEIEEKDEPIQSKTNSMIVIFIIILTLIIAISSIIILNTI